MELVYFSLTGQTAKFVKKLGLANKQVTEANPFFTLLEPFVLLVPTYDEETTSPVDKFLDYQENYQKCRGVIGSGNRNFAEKFIYTAKDICLDYHLPLLYAYEFNGTNEDVQKVKEIIERLDNGN
ncbi:class Ib ribonucleoside-diphosphate reductase assembly flavoprotein NrdI [Xylocopilactobacillus apis]|uniref:Ribonucleotide reductase assembly protein NrdI n=1 Tax=Xylocopilactobacillus apis TaxID=2932183 RepID=A0AAU9CSA1_9LACO|nr:class Ib ribonucleoside-diphosphate reductase assembly flavoprotein NrdI [Xylocopilactobacillus apis]BDR56849.1 ribonucleotide reductase assembly protein NrdI [Xylocopilactobacillus apis]